MTRWRRPRAQEAAMTRSACPHPSRRARRVAGLALAVLALACAPPASAAVSAAPDKTFVTDGEVNAVARTADKIYLGGDFSQVGPRIGHWAAISASTGQANATMPQVSGGDGVVNATVADGSGGFFIGGDFTHVGGLARSNLAHIKSDGSVDPNWTPSASSNVNALARSGSTVYIGGSFTQINATPRLRAGAVSATTGVLTGWNPIVSGRVDALAVSGSTVYLGGLFNGTNSINGSEDRNRLAAVDATAGDDVGWDPDANGAVEALAVSGDGNTVYIGGFFNGANSINGAVTRNRVAAVDAMSGADTGWNPNANGIVRDLEVSGSTVYISGEFFGANSINGTLTRNRVAAVDATTGTATGWNPNVGNGRVFALAISGSTVYIGGDFNGTNSINGTTTRNRLAAVDATTGNATSWNPNANAQVNALAVSGSTVSAGGAFTSLGGQTRNNLAALDAADGTLSAWNPNASDTVNALAVSGSTVYIGGAFLGGNSINGSLVRNRLAAVDATTGTAKAWDPDANGTVEALLVSGSTVYIGGSFNGANSINGTLTRNRVAAVNATTGSDVGWNPDAGDTVYALALSGSTVYLGGAFTTINGGTARNHAAAVDTTTGAIRADWNPGADDTVYALAHSGTTVYLGGAFTTINGGSPSNHLAAVDDFAGDANSWDPDADGTVYALAVSGPTVYVGGAFASINGGAVKRNLLAAVDATGGTATGWNPVVASSFFNDRVKALALDGGGGVIAGGAFNTLDLGAQRGLRRSARPRSARPRRSSAERRRWAGPCRAPRAAGRGRGPSPTPASGCATAERSRAQAAPPTPSRAPTRGTR